MSNKLSILASIRGSAIVNRLLLDTFLARCEAVSFIYKPGEVSLSNETTASISSK